MVSSGIAPGFPPSGVTAYADLLELRGVQTRKTHTYDWMLCRFGRAR